MIASNHNGEAGLSWSATSHHEWNLSQWVKLSQIFTCHGQKQYSYWDTHDLSWSKQCTIALHWCFCAMKMGLYEVSVCWLRAFHLKLCEIFMCKYVAKCVSLLHDTCEVFMQGVMQSFDKGYGHIKTNSLYDTTLLPSKPEASLQSRSPKVTSLTCARLHLIICPKWETLSSIHAEVVSQRLVHLVVSFI